MTTPANTPQPCIPQTAAQALALYIHQTIRPDWHPTGLTTGIGHAARASTDPAAVAIASIQAASNPANRTPAVIQYPGPHWPAAAKPDRAAAPRTPCEEHDWEPAHTCRCCISDIKLGQRPADRLGKRHDPEPEPYAGRTKPGPGQPNTSTLRNDQGDPANSPENGTQDPGATPTVGATPKDTHDHP
ncbi:hypothetical protein [Citricoccus sp. K5]|uniref:hypothetical protein n=1 Tax=Citricoccus sp. K5 TaxID=2653135 RepID=UPI0012EFD866|nr:hypothetical protein [Citricoccus sp. K5]VXA93107.1 conserved hypothetical protein [Citricoccus sp. K5]VXA95682.1 conserved hypothetical protein [Citricoccus sp. K5]